MHNWHFTVISNSYQRRVLGPQRTMRARQKRGFALREWAVITTAQGRSIKPIISNLLMGSKQFPHIPRTTRTARSHLATEKENGIFGISYTCTTSPALSTPCVIISVRYVKTILKEGLFFFCSLINARKADLCQPGFFILSIQF